MPPKVLIVDDSHFMRNVLRNTLEDEFEIVDEAQNGVEAVQLYKEHDPDVVMMDVVMPTCNGIKATAAIKQHDPDANIIMCTSVSQRPKMKLAVRAGADGYITKPFDEEEDVLATVRDIAN